MKPQQQIQDYNWESSITTKLISNVFEEKIKMLKKCWKYRKHSTWR